jgi:hypothetical protein
MRKRQNQAAMMPLLLVGVVLLATPVASGDRSDLPGLVDYRMSTLEQAKKVNGLLQARHGSGETRTVMQSTVDGDGRHLIVTGSEAAQPLLQQQLGASVDSVSWFEERETTPAPWRPQGSCDSEEECEQATDSMCEDAGHDGVDGDSVTITVHLDGSKTCSGDCESNGAVALVTCNP